MRLYAQAANCLPALLLKMRTDEGDELQLDLHLSSAKGTAEGGPRHSVRQLWVQGMRLLRLTSDWLAVVTFTAAQMGTAWRRGRDLHEWRNIQFYLGGLESGAP